MKVFLNPGHAPNGNPDPGAVNGETGLRECDVALAVGESAESYLNAAGVETELLQSDSPAKRRTAVTPTSSYPSTAMPLKPKKPTAQKPGPVLTVTVATYWPTVSNAKLLMPSIPLTGA